MRPFLMLLVLGLWMCAPAEAAYPGAASLTFAGSTKVGVTAPAVTVTLTVQTAGIAAAPVALTGGQPSLDFSITNAGACAAGSTLTVGQSCTVTVAFKPRFPGVRQGAVEIQSADGQSVLASVPLSGVGTGGLPVLVPGEITTVAGNGQWVYHGDGVAATAAPIFLPTGLAVDAAGNLYLSDSSNNRVRCVSASTGLISTVVGDGTAETLNSPSGLALDGAGNLYIADTGNNVIRRWDAVTKAVTVVAGRVGSSGFAGDNGPATSATLSSPQGIALTPAGDLVIADTGDNAVRLLTFADGKIQTVAGTGVAGYNGDGIAATAAKLNAPWGVAVRTDGAIAIADFSNERVRLVDANGAISTVVGTGDRGFSGDSDAATSAQLNGPAAVAFDPAGDLLVADSGNNRVRGVYGAANIITTLAGNSSEEFAGDAGPDNAASLYGPYALLFDPSGNIWVSDMFHNRVREINGSLLPITYGAMRVGKTSAPVFETLYNAGNDALALNAPTLNQAALDPATTTCNQSPLAPMVFCDMGVEFAPTQVGQNIAGSITWNSDAPNVNPVDALSGPVLSVEPTSVALVADANPGLLGKPVVLTATVTSADTGRTGTVTFTEGSNTWCSTTLAANGTASCTIPSLSLGSHSFVANYSGDDNNAASQSGTYVEIIKQQPALALAVSSSPTVVTNNVTLTLNAADQTGTPTGTVVFYDGTTALASVTLDGTGAATWSTKNFAVGVHSLTAQYAGDAANVAGTSNTVTEQISQASTLTVMSSSNTTPTVGTAITLTATVVSNNGPAPTGSVQFTDGTGAGAAVLGSAALAADGTASISVAGLSPGTHSLLASYLGDTDDATSSSSALSETVQQIATVMTVGADSNPLSAGATLHVTAQVAMVPGATADGALTGTVTLRDGTGADAAVLGSAAVNATGRAVFAVSSLTVGTHALVASFSGNTNYAASQAATLNETVQQTATQVTLSSAASTTLVGKTVSLTATVTSTTGIATGTVSFRDGSGAGATVLGTATVNANGIATFSTTQLPQGTHVLTAVYSGDAGYLGSTSAGLQQTVQLAQPTLTLSGPLNAVDAGTTMQAVAALTTPGATPTGTLTLLDGGTNVATLAVAANGSYTFSTNRLGIGRHTLTASYSGDADNAAAVSAAITVVVQQAPSAVTLLSSVNPLTQGGSVTLRATVTSDSPDATGTVNFMDGSTLLGAAALGTDGSTSFAITTLSLGTHTLTAVYVGDTNHVGASSAALAELVVQSAAATLASSNNPSASGQLVTFTAQIGGATSAVPTGNVTFRDDGALLATTPLNGGGAATFVTSALSVGTHTITANYAGDGNFAATGAQLVQTVVNASTQVVLASSANPGTYGQPLSLTASVASNGGAATGTVSFTDGGVVIGQATLTSTGTAVLTLSTLAPGMHSIVANYGGDGKASASVSTPLALVVKQTTALGVSAGANPTLTLAQVTLTATLTNAGAAVATGPVTFTDGAVVLGTAALDATGHAKLMVPQMSAGTHSLTVSYAGDGADFASASATYNEVVQLRSTATTVTGSSTDPTNPQQVTLIAVVKGQGSVPPSGMVTFVSGTLSMGQAPVDSTGVATVTVIFEKTTEPIVASYAGDASYAASQSGTSSIAAGQAAQFTLAVDQQNMTLVTHQHTTININLASVKGFSDTIVLGCEGLPYAATCTFSNSQLKLAADGTATASLVVDTGNPLGAGSGTSATLEHRRNGTWMCWLPFGLLAGVWRRKDRARWRQRLGAGLLMLVALVLAGGAVGCSGLSTSGTPAGTYTFKVVGTGQGSGTSEAQTVTLVVTQ